MSGTENTRPLPVIERDASARKIYLGHGGETAFICGNMGMTGRSLRKRGKHLKARRTRLHRGHKRRLCYDALNLKNIEELDTTPLREERVTFRRRLS